jgi:hypothetical protein
MCLRNIVSKDVLEFFIQIAENKHLAMLIALLVKNSRDIGLSQGLSDFL